MSNLVAELDREIYAEMRREAKRLDRSLARIMQLAWKLARERMKATPAPHNDLKERGTVPSLAARADPASGAPRTSGHPKTA